MAKVMENWLLLQDDINTLFDSNRSSQNMKGVAPGIRQGLEKKQGLFRMHMMGKRVNFAARSVISPDPWIHTKEIGIPEYFARGLTYPEPVNAHNVKEMMQCVINGPMVHPGANYVEDERGNLTDLSRLTHEARVALSKKLLTETSSESGTGPLGANKAHGTGGGPIMPGSVKRVLRHLRNGDMLLVNRQPTLHKPSIMGHMARVLRGQQTIRMHYANCATYNADYDGDELNLHFPQTEQARAEAMLIANTNNQYVKPTDGAPLRGLIQVRWRNALSVARP
jgi:DNA-directed RNA polymerase I subunit RPA1